jgi:hypothetical protein
MGSRCEAFVGQGPWCRISFDGWGGGGGIWDELAAFHHLKAQLLEGVSAIRQLF